MKSPSNLLYGEIEPRRAMACMGVKPKVDDDDHRVAEYRQLRDRA